MPSNDGTKPTVDAHEVGPSPDCIELLIGATAELDVSAIGGYPVRKVEVVAGTGSLAVRTAKSGATNRVYTAMAAGSKIEPLQITSIRGTSDGSSALTVRVYK